ncbi:hypothetical protein Hanom_Chr14g01292621 [Helianthus anomalus]
MIKLSLKIYIFFLNGQQTQSRVLSGHPLDKRSHPPVGRTVKLPVKPVWLKDPTQVFLGLLSLPTRASLCTKWESNLHLSREM